MSNRNYVCKICGAARRAPAAYYAPLKATGRNPKLSRPKPKWPLHCSQPMLLLSMVQGEASNHLTDDERKKWVMRGMYVVRRSKHGKRKWRPVTSAWHRKVAMDQIHSFYAPKRGRR